VRIDAHAHAQPPEYLDALLASGRYESVHDAEGRIVVRERGSRFLTITPQMHHPEQRVAEMDEAGIDMQILSVRRRRSTSCRARRRSIWHGAATTISPTSCGAIRRGSGRWRACR